MQFWHVGKREFGHILERLGANENISHVQETTQIDICEIGVVAGIGLHF